MAEGYESEAIGDIETASQWLAASDQGKQQYLSNLTANEKEILNVAFDPTKATGTQLLRRYKTVAESKDPNFRNIVEGLYSMGGGPGARDTIGQYVYDQGVEALGRDPTANEFDKVFGLYGGDPNWSGNIRQYWADYSETVKRKEPPPEVPYEPGAPGGRGTPEWAGQQVYNVFGNLLGRDPSDSELQYYGSRLIDEDDPWEVFEIEQAIKETDEFQKAEDVKFQEELGPRMEAMHEPIFEKAKQSALASFMRAGTQHGPALDYAIADIMKDLASQRESFLLPLTAQQYGGRQQTALADYQRRLNEYLRNIQTAKAGRQSYSTGLISRGWAGTDYQTKMNDWLNWLANQQGGADKYGWLEPAGQVGGMGAAYLAGATNPWAYIAAGQFGRGLGQIWS